MTGNRLIERRESKETGKTEHCPSGYGDPHAWCAWRNASMKRNDVLWIVGPNGSPILVDDEAVCAELHRKDKALKDDEARRHNRRVLHPIDEIRAA